MLMPDLLKLSVSLSWDSLVHSAAWLRLGRPLRVSSLRSLSGISKILIDGKKGAHQLVISGTSCMKYRLPSITCQIWYFCFIKNKTESPLSNGVKEHWENNPSAFSGKMSVHPRQDWWKNFWSSQEKKTDQASGSWHKKWEKSNPKSKNVSVFKNNSSGGKLLFWFMSAILRSGNGDRQILFFLNQLAGNY